IHTISPTKEAVAMFQLHTFMRTNTFLYEFAISLEAADEVYLCDIFSSARESSGELTIQDLQDRVAGSNLLELDNVEILKQYEDSVLVFMGAGDIQKFQTAYEESVKKDSTRA